MGQGAPQAIEAPDDQGVAGAQVAQDVLQDGAIRLGATGRLGEDFAAASLSEGIQLKVEGLFAGRDPGVANVHVIIVSKLREEHK